MTEVQRKEAAHKFVEYWKDKGNEKQESQSFWLSLLQQVYDIEEPEKFILFEEKVMLDHASFIDGFIPSTHVMIEQKSRGKDLRAPIRQSDGTRLTPFQQAKRYSSELPYSSRPRWIVTCNFQSFLVYDMEQPNGEPEEILLENLPDELYRLQFLVETGNEHIKREMQVSMQAGEIVGLLYDAILKQYKDPTSEHSLKSLNMLCVRLVFCLYAEDASIFGNHGAFHDYLKRFEGRDLRRALIDLFRVLDQREEERDPYLDEELAAFPYVNGGLFADENIEIPTLTEEIRDLLLNRASEGFNWKEISPTIFGAVFESTLNPETRRKGGMHYTSIENIHKIIDPLFMDKLHKEFEEIVQIKENKKREKALKAFQKKLSQQTFLDPACGSGNFLTETYLSLRRLENQVIRMLTYDQQVLGGMSDYPWIQVSIGQFYGIEINDFAVTVAKTALWIAEAQMMEETESIVHQNLDFLPLKSYANIVEGNALRIDWEDVVSKEKLNYIMGNPPFVGFTYMSDTQKADMEYIFPKTKNLDFVAAWYKVASDYIQNTPIECGFVSTNSITQGETVTSLWKYLNIHINFAYRTFIWDSEAKIKAHVHCVIIGFAAFDRPEKVIYQGERVIKVQNINAYLCDAPNVLVESRNKPLYNVSPMVYGNKPADGGYLIIEDKDYEQFIEADPQAKQFIKPFLGAAEYLHGKKRWCLWLKDADPHELRKCPMILERVKKCRETRLNSVAAAIRKFAETPTLFAQITQPMNVNYIIVPRVSSERRKYIPMGFLDSSTIVSDAVQIVPNATLYEFGIITSNVHMAWMRAVCGRLKSDYRYSKDVVYNNFPWPAPTDAQKAKIENTAQAILDARALYPDCSLADLYDELTMPKELRKAHQNNDRAVMEAYGFPVKNSFTESMCVAELMKLYQRKVLEEENRRGKKNGKTAYK